MIGNSFADDKHGKELAGWSNLESSLLTPVDDPGTMTAVVFKRNNLFGLI